METHRRLKSDFSDAPSCGREGTPLGALLKAGRVIGGKRQGEKQPDQRQDLPGFEDYTLYIRLMKCELKILLMPIYLSLLRGKGHANASSNGHSNANAHCDSLQSDSENFESHSFSKSGSDELHLGGEDYSSDNPFKDSLHIARD